MATVSTTAPASPLIDVLKSATNSYVQSVKAEIVLSDEARFEANRDWCENYKCPAIDMVGPGIMSTILAYILKALDLIIQFALSIIYNLLSMIMAAFVTIAGPVAALVDAVLIFTCYLYNMYKGNLLATCCTDVTLIEVIIALLKKIWGIIKPIIRKVLEIWFTLVELYEQLMYQCDCDRLAEEQYAEEIKEIKELYGNQYSDYKVVTGDIPGDSVAVGTPVPPNVQAYTKNNDGVMYIKVKMKSPPVGKIFMEHVRQTIGAYNRYPFGADEYCWTQTAEYLVAAVAWKTYAEALVSIFLSSVNLKSLLNANGIDYAKYRARLEYCKRTMPEPLYEYVVRRCTSAEDREDIIRMLGLDG